MPTLPVLVIACGALGREIVALRAANAWDHLHLACLPASLHNRPECIPDALRQKIRAARAEGYQNIFVAYGDCGTGGQLDAALEEEGVERIKGAHCYEFFTGSEAFNALSNVEPGTFYLTDFLARHFESIVVCALGLDRHPDLLPAYFANYRKLLYLTQTRDDRLLERARMAAKRLGLLFEVRYTGYGGLEDALKTLVQPVVNPVVNLNFNPMEACHA